MGYSGVYVFGDSLVDAGNALELAEFYGDLTFSDLPEGAPSDDLGYFEGRFTNGYTFADLVANKLIGTVTGPVFPFGYEDPWLGAPLSPFASDPSGNNLNFAYGGAQIRQGGEVVPDLDGQTDAFRDAVDGNADPNALYLIAIGGNDVRNLAPSGGDPVAQADAFAALDRAAEKYLTELSQLVEMGAQHIVITGVPDVGLVPSYDRDGDRVLDAAEQQRADAATDYSVYLDTLIRTEVVPALQALGATVTYVPVMDYVDASGNLVTGALNANLGTIAALHGLTADQLSGSLLQHQELLFFDHLHPNAQANALLGAYMHAQITGTPWVETLPLTSAEVDYRMNGSIAAPGEVDKIVVSLVAGTTYTLDMLGVSSLGTAGSLADPALRVLAPSGSVVGSNADSGAGFDATLTFTAARTGNYTVELSGTGAPLGTYVLQATVIGGSATQAGNRYTVNAASTVVLEGAGGIGDDVVNARVSYALTAGSEIEVLATANASATTPINLTGNEFGQSIYGNAGNNILTGGGGADYLVGLGGNDHYHVDTLDFISEAPGGGDDRIFVSTSYHLRDGVEIETLIAANQDSTDRVDLTGNEYGQSLYGSQGANTLNGGGGNDYLVGLGGNDFLIGGAGNDNLAGGQGNDIYYVDSGDSVVEAAVEGDDRVVAFANYTLGSGAHVETLAAAEGAAINLTGNALGQSLYGNASGNVLTAGGGADYLVGGGGNDTFVLSNAAVTSPGAANIAIIGDYGSGDVVDVTQILSVAAGTNVVTGGYLRVTGSGLIQVDLDGGANNWVTLSSVSGTNAVALRYLSGGSIANVSVSRLSEGSSAAASLAAVTKEPLGAASTVDAMFDTSSANGHRLVALDRSWEPGHRPFDSEIFDFVQEAVTAHYEYAPLI